MGFGCEHGRPAPARSLALLAGDPAWPVVCARARAIPGASCLSRTRTAGQHCRAPLPLPAPWAKQAGAIKRPQGCVTTGQPGVLLRLPVQSRGVAGVRAVAPPAGHMTVSRSGRVQAQGTYLTAAAGVAAGSSAFCTIRMHTHGAVLRRGTSLRYSTGRTWVRTRQTQNAGGVTVTGRSYRSRRRVRCSGWCRGERSRWRRRMLAQRGLQADGVASERLAGWRWATGPWVGAMARAAREGMAGLGLWEGDGWARGDESKVGRQEVRAEARKGASYCMVGRARAWPKALAGSQARTSRRTVWCRAGGGGVDCS